MPAEQALAGLGSPSLGVVVLVVLAVLGAVGWAGLRRGRAPVPLASAAHAAGWVEGACPACLALTAIRRDA